MQTVVNLRDHAVHVIPFHVDGVRVFDEAEVEVAAGGSIKVTDECANGAPHLGRGGLLDAYNEDPDDAPWGPAGSSAKKPRASKAKKRVPAIGGGTVVPDGTATATGKAGPMVSDLIDGKNEKGN